MGGRGAGEAGLPTWGGFPMPLMCTSFVPGDLWAAVARVEGEQRRAIARAEALYFTARPDEALSVAEPQLRICLPFAWLASPGARLS